jgi:integrase
MQRHVTAKGLRTQYEIKRILSKYLLPVLGARPITEIKRSDIVHVLDRVEDEHGARMADACLTILRSIMVWHARRTDAFTPPFVSGMKRCTARPRERILTDDEIRILWPVAEASGAFGALLQLALLTAQRKAKLLGMKWSDIDGGTWTVPTEDREKGTGGELVLPDLARAILRRQRESRVHGSDLVFVPANGAGKMSSSHGMLKIKAKLPKGFPEFTIHDLRRTARSLMSKAGVNPEHAERVMGHVIPGVEGIYDRHSYRDEKRIALEKLAALIDQIISGKPSDKIVPMRARS